MNDEFFVPEDGGKLILGTYSHARNTHAEEMAKMLKEWRPPHRKFRFDLAAIFADITSAK